jgi:hypothetical protein
MRKVGVVLALDTQLGCREASALLPLPLRSVTVSRSRSAWQRCLRRTWTYPAIAAKMKIRITPRAMAGSRSMCEMSRWTEDCTWVMGGVGSVDMEVCRCLFSREMGDAGR